MIKEREILIFDNKKTLFQLKDLFKIYNEQKLILDKTKEKLKQSEEDNNKLQKMIGINDKNDFDEELKQQRSTVEKLNVT